MAVASRLSEELLEIALTGFNTATRDRLAGFPAAAFISDLLAVASRVQMIKSTENQYSCNITRNMGEVPGPAVSRGQTSATYPLHNRYVTNSYRPGPSSSQYSPKVLINHPSSPTMDGVTTLAILTVALDTSHTALPSKQHLYIPCSILKVLTTDIIPKQTQEEGSRMRALPSNSLIRH
ncbi:hypothetical protein J6590_048510 [Homalodisca vitripennis]|nr:hypothetical protein J6590_048510 [Homalodisca vitripennis]